VASNGQGVAKTVAMEPIIRARHDKMLAVQMDAHEKNHTVAHLHFFSIQFHSLRLRPWTCSYCADNYTSALLYIAWKGWADAFSSWRTHNTSGPALCNECGATNAPTRL